MNILFAIDRGYIEHLIECIQSIVRFPSDDGYDIYIMHSDFIKEDKEELCKQLEDNNTMLHFIYIDPARFEQFPDNERYPQLIYYRIFAPLYLPKDMDRVLYLDADTIAINSLEELYHMSFDGNYYLACTHVKRMLNKINEVRLGTQGVTYINSGIMLMNLELLRRNFNENEIIDFVKEKKPVLMLPDQDVISALYGDKIKLVDTMKYNLSDRMLYLHNSDIRNEKIDLDWVRKNSVIIHYYGKQKPWKKAYFGMLNVFYEELKRSNI